MGGVCSRRKAEVDVLLDDDPMEAEDKASDEAEVDVSPDYDPMETEDKVGDEFDDPDVSHDWDPMEPLTRCPQLEEACNEVP